MAKRKSVRQGRGMRAYRAEKLKRREKVTVIISVDYEEEETG